MPPTMDSTRQPPTDTSSLPSASSIFPCWFLPSSRTLPAVRPHLSSPRSMSSSTAGTRCNLAPQAPASGILSSPSFFSFSDFTWAQHFSLLWASVRCGWMSSPSASVLAFRWHEARGQTCSPLAPASSFRCSSP